MFGKGVKPAAQSAKKLVAELEAAAPESVWGFDQISDLEPTKKILAAEPDVQIEIIKWTTKAVRSYWEKVARLKARNNNYFLSLIRSRDYPRASIQIIRRLLRRDLPFTEDDILFLLDETIGLGSLTLWNLPYLEMLVARVESFVERQGLTPAMTARLGDLEKAIVSGNAPEAKLRQRIARLRTGSRSIPLETAEPWARQAQADLDAMPPHERAAWIALLDHCLAASGGQPSPKWLKAADTLLEAVGRMNFTAVVLRWFPLLAETSGPANDINADILKGLAWLCSSFPDAEVARGLTTLALAAYKSLPGYGPKAAKVGHACLYALGAMSGLNGVAQLAILKTRVRNKTARKLIEKALAATAERLGVPPDELEEMSVSTYGLTTVGMRREEIGGYTAELRVTDSYRTQLVWLRPDGREQKTIPAAIKEEHVEELADLKEAARDIERMLPAQRDRLDRLFVQRRTWDFQTWRERYLDHPLVGILARRLIWRFTTNGETVDGIWYDGRLTGLDGEPIPSPGAGTKVELWHPIDQTPERVMAWRNWLERHRIKQPFKQAHREVYLLTEAERRTRVYSNRYAGHIVKQHQFNALCAVRGWHNVLKLLVDEEFPPPSLRLPQWGIRAEFWTDGVGDNYGVDTNEAGTFLYLATDQVRFLPLDAPEVKGHAYGRGQVGTADPIPLELVPPLVFSEVMRDIDLFVGVASVGNDPMWSDGGPEGRYRDYWQSYSFGELTETAQTRKQILEGLLPRLKIRERCSLEDRFLVVRGDLRTYRIHLGSSNILMSPGDQYLCIVPARGGDVVTENKIFLPFEGDQTLSVILSKAFLLAEDAKITDPTIVSQIRK